MEIYDKLLKLANEIHGQEDSMNSGAGVSSSDTTNLAPQGNSVFNESVDALMALGYKQKDAEK